MDCTNDEELSNKVEKRPIQDVSGCQDPSPPKLLTTPRRSRGRPNRKSNTTPLTRPVKGEAASSLTEQESTPSTSLRKKCSTRSLDRTPVVVGSAVKVPFSGATPVGQKTVKAKDSTTLITRRNVTESPSNKTPYLTGTNKDTASCKKPVSKGVSSKIPQANRSLCKLKASSKVSPKDTVTDKCKQVMTPSTADTGFKENPGNASEMVQSNGEEKLAESCRPGDLCSDKNANNEIALEKKENIMGEQEQNAEENIKCDLTQKRLLEVSGDSREEKENTATMEKVELSAELSLNIAPGDTEEPGSGPSEVQEKNDIQAEVDKVKRRRSTIGRGRSCQSLGGRRSLCASLPVFSLEDQIRKIESDLPWASTLSHILDITMREACRRLVVKYPEDECVPDLRVDVITQSEAMAGDIAYNLAGRQLVLNPQAHHTPQHVHTNIDKIGAYKKKIHELEHEYKQWKVLMKERKVACRAAEREYREAKSGHTKIYEDQASSLTSIQRNLLACRPNYQQYIREAQTVQEKVVLRLSEVKLSTVALSSLITASRLQAESSYAAVEAVSFGHLKSRPIKSILASCLNVDQTMEADACEA